MAAAPASAVALAPLVACELRRAEPLVDIRMFADARFAALSVTAVLVTVVLAGWLFLTTLYLQDVRGAYADGSVATNRTIELALVRGLGEGQRRGRI